MNWSDVGNWLKDNGTAGAALVGSLLTGNIPGAVAAGTALVSSATGVADPAKALQALQTDPATMLKLRELAVQEESDIRAHLRAMAELELKDQQEAHRQQQETIRNGDNAEDEYVRHTRPMIARHSWYATCGYAVLFEVLKAFGTGTGANADIIMLLGTPTAAYLGFRSFDKFRRGRAA